MTERRFPPPWTVEELDCADPMETTATAHDALVALGPVIQARIQQAR